MVDSGSVHTGLVRRGYGWRAWIFVLALLLAGVTVAEAVCHEEHEVDQDCAVCQLRHQPAAEPSASVHIGYADAAQPGEPTDDGGLTTPGHLRRHFARGPPA